MLIRVYVFPIAAQELTKVLASCKVRVVVAWRHDIGTYLIKFKIER
jgi:hypothetical protein